MELFYIFYYVFFFFQAEDGIRYWSVTGVQTCALPIFDPLVVLPLVPRPVHDRRGRRWQLGLEGERIGLLPLLARRGGDEELVALTLGRLGDDALPDARSAARVERHAGPVPRGEVAGHPHGPGRRCPHGEGDPTVLQHVRAEAFVEAVVAAFAQQVEVEISEAG